MKVYTNERRVKRNRLQQFVAVFANTALLLVGLFAVMLVGTTVIAPQIASSPVLIIAIGLLSTLIGVQAGNEISRMGIPHEALNDGLRGLGADTALYHYTLPADHVLVTPRAVYSLTVRPQQISVSFDGNRLTVHDALHRRFMRTLTQQRLGNPVAQAQRDAAAVQRWLKDNLGADISVQPAIVFTNPSAELEIEGSPSVPILRADKRKPSLKAFVRESGTREGRTHTVDLDALNAALGLTT